jgi:N-acetylmuramoyl-L-alanine amidase
MLRERSVAGIMLPGVWTMPRKAAQQKPGRQQTALRARRVFLLLLAAAVAGGLWLAQHTAQAGGGPGWLQILFGPPQPLARMRVGLVAGHHGNDSGTVCPDGLTEAEINLRIAESVAESLRAQGVRVDVLDEFDRRLQGYRADAFVSLHADSCAVDLSGFKVASQEGGSAASERLATCLWDRYEAATGLPRHVATITNDMLLYHAFREIAPTTPAAIIETGFLSGDRVFLTEHADQAAAGIVQGVTCFLAPQ